MVNKITNPPSQKDLIDKVNELVDDKQDTLVSGTNIKTINNTSILGSGNIVIQAGADVDLSNITSTGKNIANWSTNVSNCIISIPQDIKLELSSGTLTLKAGSKCYVKGDTTTPTFNITSDKSTTQSTDGSYFAFYDGTSLVTYSKSTYDYSTLPSTTSFPLAEITVSGGAISSIDQVFNGFGYIGSTVFALPKVKGFIPKGRNADGTLNNTLVQITAVTTNTYSGTNNLFWGFTSGNHIYNQAQRAVIYNEKENTTTWETAIFASGEVSGGTTISNFVIKTVFHALDYNDKSTISGWAMPSNRYINLTLGASGTQYTAPTNGMLYLSKKATAANQYIGFLHSGSDYQEIMRASGAVDIFVNTLVRKGETVTVLYSANGTTTNDRFLFIYAEGEK